MHVRQLITTPVGRQAGQVPHLRAQDQNRPRRLARIDGVQDDQGVGGIEKILDEVNATDADLDHAHPFGEGPGEQALRGHDTEPVVGSEYVAHARDQNLDGN